MVSISESELQPFYVIVKSNQLNSNLWKTDSLYGQEASVKASEPNRTTRVWVAYCGLEK